MDTGYPIGHPVYFKNEGYLANMVAVSPAATVAEERARELERRFFIDFLG